MGWQEESTRPCCPHRGWERVRALTLPGAAGKAGKAQARPASQPCGSRAGPMTGTAPTESPWGLMSGSGAPGSSDSRGPRDQCGVDKGYLVAAAASEREGGREAGRALASGLSVSWAVKPQKGQQAQGGQQSWYLPHVSPGDQGGPEPARPSPGARNRQRASSRPLAGRLDRF